MKKVIMGTGLFLCGTIIITGMEICGAVILNPNPGNIIHWEDGGLKIFGVLLFAVGILLSGWGLFEKEK